MIEDETDTADQSMEYGVESENDEDGNESENHEDENESENEEDGNESDQYEASEELEISMVTDEDDCSIYRLAIDRFCNNNVISDCLMVLVWTRKLKKILVILHIST